MKIRKNRVPAGPKVSFSPPPERKQFKAANQLNVPPEVKTEVSKSALAYRRQYRDFLLKQGINKMLGYEKAKNDAEVVVRDILNEGDFEADEELEIILTSLLKLEFSHFVLSKSTIPKETQADFLSKLNTLLIGRLAPRKLEPPKLKGKENTVGVLGIKK